MYISTPKEIEEVIQTVPKGTYYNKLIARKLAKKHDADYTCPLTTGIFTAIIANAVEENSKGLKELTPYWRVLKGKGILYDKYLGQPSHQRENLETEDFEVVATKNKRYFS